MNDSYKNPFSGVNAVQLNEDSILDYWCSPFTYDLFSGIKEKDIYEDNMNIVFMGGRSTGKSMFLRYWSYKIQFKAAIKVGNKLSENIAQNKGIGFYFRIDGPTLKSFQGYDLSHEHWGSIFTLYFELTVGRQYVDALRILQNDESFAREVSENNLVLKLCEHLDFPIKNNLEEIIQEFDKKIKHIDRFRGDVPFYKKPYHPEERGYPSEYISFRLAEIILDNVPSLRGLNFIILLDEYENFLEYQQVIINTLLRFTKPNIKFRIGMRLEGFRTFSMISNEDFIKEGREYRKVVFEDVINKSKGYHQFLIEIATKRLITIPLLKENNFTNIESILSKNEDLENEAIELVKNNSDKVYEFFSKMISEKDLSIVRYKDNPLLELLNFIWLTRGFTPEATLKSMQDFLENKRTADARKYRNDYINKYKLSLMFLLCSINKQNKLYYSFKTYAYLSSGIVGHFIELCRRAFAIAGWGDNDKLIHEGKISREIQSQAALELSKDELQQISRIEVYGGRISRFIINIGNIFRDLHRDPNIRYPETNQFSINLDAIQDNDLQKALRDAIKWSVIQRKPKLQTASPGENLQEIYTINRIFAPSFKISYRTRGGFSITLNDKKLTALMYNEEINATDILPKKRSSDEEDSNQASFL